MSLISAAPQLAARVLIIGLDGATWTNLLPRAQGGEMPTLQKLLGAGAWGVLNSTIPALTPPAWASLVTGTNPGKHGIYHFRHTPAGDYHQRRLNNSRDIHAAPVWQRAGQHGRQVGVINVPLTYPVYPVNGFITSDALTPNLDGFIVHPAELNSDFQNVPPDISKYPTALPDSARYLGQMLEFIEENERVLIQHADVAVRMMRSRPWQFFMVVWLILDRLQHFAWKFCSSTPGTSFPGAADKQIADRCSAAFRQIDAQLARLIEAAGENCTVMLVSDHGFGPIAGAFFHTNRWLVQQGYLRLRPAWHWRRWLLGNAPRAWRSRWRIPIDSKFGVVDWKTTRVWADCLEARAVGLRINRAERYPEGTVSNSDYEALREKLIAELKELEVAPGKRIFRDFHRREQLYHGPHADAAPDLVAILERDFDGPPSFRRDLSSRRVITQNTHVLRDGGHEPEGIFLLHGSDVRKGVRLPPQEIECIAPTALELLGVPLGEDMDGKPIEAALRPEFSSLATAQRSDANTATANASSQQPEYSDADSQLVEERLRNLGYLD